MRLCLDVSHSTHAKNLGGIARVEHELKLYLKKNFYAYELLFVDFLESNVKFLKPSSQDVYIFAGPLWRYDYQFQIRWLKDCGAKIVFFIYDILPILYSDYHFEIAEKFKRHINFCIDVADDLIFINDYTKSNFLDLYSENKSSYKIHLLNGLAASSSPVFVDNNNLKDDIVFDRFIMYVSGFHPRKNHELIFGIYESLVKDCSKNSIPKFVMVAGNAVEGDEILSRIRSSPAASYFVVHKKCSDDNLYYLYKKSLFTIYPSLFEGWGMPITEALNMGKAVICSDDPSMDAACQNLCIRLNPNDYEGWKREILLLTNDEDYRKKNEIFISDNYKISNWSCIFAELMRCLGVLGRNLKV
jgi:glycosyltransferase involved in cell wall biosynthesis